MIKYNVQFRNNSQYSDLYEQLGIIIEAVKFESKRRNRESKPGELKIPIEILADLLKNGGADLRERDLAEFGFGKTPCPNFQNLKP